MTRSSKAVLLGALGLTAYLLAESFFPARVQPTARLSGAAIDAYQAVGSPALKAIGVRCRYTPTCSHYAEDAIGHYGTLGGVARTAGRLWRCSPWGGSGHDPAVPGLSTVASTTQQETPEERKAREEAQKKAAEEMKKAAEELDKVFKDMPQHAGEAAGMGIACCIISVIGALAGIAVTVFMLVFVYKDAKARGDANAVLWLVLVFFLGLIGFVVYIVARPKGDLAPCANCKNKMMTTLVKCPHCGTDTGAAAAPPPKA